MSALDPETTTADWTTKFEIGQCRSRPGLNYETARRLCRITVLATIWWVFGFEVVSLFQFNNTQSGPIQFRNSWREAIGARVFIAFIATTHELSVSVELSLVPITTLVSMMNRSEFAPLTSGVEADTKIQAIKFDSRLDLRETPASRYRGQNGAVKDTRTKVSGNTAHSAVLTCNPLSLLDSHLHTPRNAPLWGSTKC